MFNSLTRSAAALRMFKLQVIFWLDISLEVDSFVVGHRNFYYRLHIESEKFSEATVNSVWQMFHKSIW